MTSAAMKPPINDALNRTFAIVLATVAAAVVFATGHSSAATHPTISLDDAARLDLTKSSIIDVRYAGDYRRSHIKGAISIPYYKLDKIDLPKERPIVTYCSGIGCALGMDTAAKLKEMGYTNVRYLLGGISEWDLKGYPIVRDEIPVKPAGPGMFESAEIAPPVVNRNLDKVFVLDTRSEQEYTAGHVPGSRNIPLERLTEGLGELRGEIIVCDRTPARWKKAVLLLKEKGFDAHAMSGGIGAWAGSKLKLDVGADER